MSTISAGPFSLNDKTGASDGVDWVKTVLLAYTLTMGGFVLFESLLHIPEGWAGAGFQSPYEDISSQGSIAVALLILIVSSIRSTPLRMLSSGILCSLATLTLLIASWSRGAWLAGICWLLLAAWCRLPARWFTMMIMAGVSAVAFINLNANQASWQQNNYLSRLVQLVRVEGIASKSTGRLELWHKAIGMIKERPVTGHGIGSFYLKSPRYALPNDPYAQAPDFAHHAFLQIAAEQGVPVALLLAALCGWTLWLGFRMWLQDKDRHSNPSDRSLLALGVTLALGAYLQTQMTANSLNVYVSNQFFFWFLMAALLSLTQYPPRASKNQDLPAA